jgi:protein-S-isoprenylcysteine O-methyltransferase Ste14
MKTRFAASLVLCSAVLLGPIAAHPERLLHPAPWLAVAISMIVLLSQPTLELGEAASRSAADRGSALVIFAAMIGAQLTAAVEFGTASRVSVGIPFMAGAAIAIAGLALRLRAIRALGCFFTSTVRVLKGQVVVRSGPYRWLRHPSYTGALLTGLGTVISLESGIGVVMVAALCVPAYLYRIRVEERALVVEFGRAYAEYRQTTWGLVPGIY